MAPIWCGQEDTLNFSVDGECGVDEGIIFCEFDDLVFEPILLEECLHYRSKNPGEGFVARIGQGEQREVASEP